MAKQNITKFLLLLIAFTFVLSANYLFAAWVGPTQAPPGGNTDTPVHIGTTNQVKDGGLSLNTLTVFGNGWFQDDVALDSLKNCDSLITNADGKIICSVPVATSTSSPPSSPSSPSTPPTPPAPQISWACTDFAAQASGWEFFYYFRDQMLTNPTKLIKVEMGNWSCQQDNPSYWKSFVHGSGESVKTSCTDSDGNSLTLDYDDTTFYNSGGGQWTIRKMLSITPIPDSAPDFTGYVRGINGYWSNYNSDNFKSFRIGINDGYSVGGKAHSYFLSEPIKICMGTAI